MVARIRTMAPYRTAWAAADNVEARVATQPDLTDEQRANLTKLAAYLRTLPADYPDFEMSLFTQDGNGRARSPAHATVCGTAACAAGHGPNAGIPPKNGENWADYASRAFIDEGENWEAWQWCFGAGWHRVDNSAHGAAARIQWMFERGVPENSRSQLYGEADLCYTAQVPA